MKAPPQKSQPIEFSGRREATKAPTVENAKITIDMSAVVRADEVGTLSEARRSVRAPVSKVDTHNDQASQEAVRGLIPPTP